MTAACILGCAGRLLGEDEAAFFREIQPWGFILFGRNIESPDQVRRLVADLRATVGRPDAPVLVDQEGGRVQRLGPPHWRRYPPARSFAEGRESEAARRLARAGGRDMARDLAALGINVDCAPVLDLPGAGAHAIIGDRAFSEAPAAAADLARAMAEGLLAGGVLPIVKHTPGHGRATLDSHEQLPVVDTSLAELEAWDFVPFRLLADLPMAMTAHVVYSAIDPDRPATTSPLVIDQAIRGSIGFDGLLISDDLSMKALNGPMRARTRAAHAAGCDIVLHCNGDPQEMREVVAGASVLQGPALRRAQAALAWLARPVEAA